MMSSRFINFKILHHPRRNKHGNVALEGLVLPHFLEQLPQGLGPIRYLRFGLLSP